jgi:hypothetical protein
MTKWKKVTLCFMGIVILAAWAVVPFFSALQKAFDPLALVFKTDF